jgi:hypothetical protein
VAQPPNPVAQTPPPPLRGGLGIKTVPYSISGNIVQKEGGTAGSKKEWEKSPIPIILSSPYTLRVGEAPGATMGPRSAGGPGPPEISSCLERIPDTQ